MFLLGKLKMYLAAAGVIFAAFIAAYFRGRRDSLHEYELEADKELIKKLRTAKDVEDEIEALDDPYLVDRASRWVRKDQR